MYFGLDLKMPCLLRVIMPGGDEGGGEGRPFGDSIGPEGGVIGAIVGENGLGLVR